jgi:Transglycosylase SLT domain
LLRHLIQSVALTVTALTAAVATPLGGAMLRPADAQRRLDAQPAALPSRGALETVAASEHLDASWQAELQLAGQQVVDEQHRQDVVAAARAAAATAPPPTPATPSPPAVAPGGSIQQDIIDAFQPLGSAAVQWGLAVARCESSYNPIAVNASSGAEGLFQFMPSTFAGTPPGRAGGSIWDPVAQSQAAAWMYTQRRQAEWSCNP